MSTTKKYCDSAGDVPTGDHYVIIEFSTVTIHGDERSRTNPGHGYPEHIERTIQYIIFTNRKDWEDDIRQREERGERNYVPIVAKPVEVTTKVSVSIGLKA